MISSPTAVHIHLSPTGSLSLSYLSTGTDDDDIGSPLVSPSQTPLQTPFVSPKHTKPTGKLSSSTASVFRSNTTTPTPSASLKVTSSLPKSNNEENVSPQIGTKGGGFDKVERMLLPFTPATSKSPLRKSQVREGEAGDKLSTTTLS